MLELLTNWIMSKKLKIYTWCGLVESGQTQGFSANMLSPSEKIRLVPS